MFPFLPSFNSYLHLSPASLLPICFSLSRSKYSRPCFNHAPSIFLFSPFLPFFVSLSLIHTFLVLSCSRSQHLPDTSLRCYLPSVLVSFSLICLYSRPTVASRFPVTISFWLMPAFHLSSSFRPLSVHVCNTLSSPFIIFPLRSYSLSLFIVVRSP